MPFEKGKSGNPDGRPEGAKNKITGELRTTITNFLEDNFEKVVQDFNALSPKERAKLYCDLLQYGLPKLQSVSLGLEEKSSKLSLGIAFEKMTDEQLNKIIDELKSHAESTESEE
ncbi:MAG TPA: DUF5681 domain-containing protein [Chitinophagaceae bacterium]|nr:DUF5681 domain-containing protein [Chitinophagaceae bacterium]